MKFRPVGAELFCAEEQIDETKLIVAFRSFANALRNSYLKDQLVHNYFKTSQTH